jgi:hypothetical protein
MKAKIRKLVTIVDEIQREMGREVAPPTRRAVALAVIENPFAGKYQEDLSDLMAIGEELGGLLTEKCVAALGIEGGKAESFGKAAIVGEKGELEHAAAILHPKMGTPVRKVLVKGPALIPSAKKMGGPGTAIDVPLGHKDAAFVRSHFDAIEARVPDAPRAGEIVVAIAVTDSGRPLPRIGGLQKHEIKGEDGLR